MFIGQRIIEILKGQFKKVYQRKEKEVSQYLINPTTVTAPLITCYKQVIYGI